MAYKIVVDEGGSHRDRWVAAGIYRLAGSPATSGSPIRTSGTTCSTPTTATRARRRGSDRSSDGVPFDRQYRMLRRDGDVVWVHDRAVVTERDGRPMSRAPSPTSPRATTPRTRSGWPRTRFRTLVEQLPAITYIEDADDGREPLHQPADRARSTATPPEEWMADPQLWEERLHPDDRDWVVADNDAETGDDWSVDYRAIARDGRVALAAQRRSARPRRRRASRCTGRASSTTSPSASSPRSGCATPRSATARLVEQLPVAVYTDAVDEVSTALYISPQYEQLTGYTPEQRLAGPGPVGADAAPRAIASASSPSPRGRTRPANRSTSSTGSWPADGRTRLAPRPRDAGGGARRQAHLAGRAAGRDRSGAAPRTRSAARRDLAGDRLRRRAVPARTVVAGRSAEVLRAARASPAKRPACACSGTRPSAGRLGGSRSSTAWRPRGPSARGRRHARDGFRGREGGFGRWADRARQRGDACTASSATFPASERRDARARRCCGSGR